MLYKSERGECFQNIDVPIRKKVGLAHRKSRRIHWDRETLNAGATTHYNQDIIFLPQASNGVFSVEISFLVLLKLKSAEICVYGKRI